jgi:putative membrane protein
MSDYPNDENGLARQRTDLAQQRNLLATERTFAAWIRTGLAAVAAGLGIAGLLENLGPPRIIRSIAVILVLAGGGIYVLALWRYVQGYRRLRQEGERVTSLIVITGLIVALVVTAALALALLAVYQGV